MEVAEKTYNLKLIFRESKEFIDISPEKPKFFKSLPQKTSKLQKQTSLSDFTYKIDSCLKKTNNNFIFKSKPNFTPLKTASLLQSVNCDKNQRIKFLNLRSVIKKNPCIFFLSTRQSNFLPEKQPKAKFQDLPLRITPTDLQIVKPFFISDKKTLNQEYQKIDSENLRKAYFSRRRIKTDVENFLEYEFPLHHNFDIIKRHNQGFLNKENLDFFKHLHRLFFKNKYFFEEKNQIIRKAFLLFNKTQTLETIFSETPLKMRKFIIEKNLIDIKMYEELLLRYEDEKSLGVFFPIKNKIETPQEQLKIIDMNAIKFQAQTDQQDLLEENFIVSILEKVNASGLASLVTREIMEFKKIIERRKITLKSLQSNIEAEMNLTKPRGHYRTRTMHPINNLSEDIDKTNPKSDRANTDATEKLNKWNNMKHENTERYIDDNRAIRKKEAKELNNFQNMFKKLKEKKKQEKSEKNKDKFQNIGNLIFRLETVKMNLVSRLNLTEIGQDFTNFHQLSNTKAFFNKYLQNELGLLSENLPESEYFETTKYKAGDSRSSEFFITKKKVILKEIAHKRPTNEKKNLKKKTGKISKFHRFSSKNSYKDDETYSKQNNDNNLLSINESDSEKSDLETKPLKPRKFKTNSFNPEPKQNSNNNDKKDIAFKLNNEVKPIKIDKNPLMLTKYFSEELELSKNDPTQKNDNYKKSVIVENSNSFNLKKEELKVFKKIDFSNKQKIKKLSLNKFTKSSPMPSVSMSLKKGTSKDEDNIIAQTQRKPTYVNNSNEIDEQTIPHAWDHNSLEESQDINLLQSPLNEKKILNLKVLTTISRDKSKKISTVKNLHDNKMEDVQNIESSSIIPQKKNIKKRKVQEKAEEIQIQSINIAKSITSSNSLNSNIQTFEENNNNKIYDNNEIGISNLDSLLAALENKKNQPLRKTYVHKSSILLEVQKKTNTIEKKPTKNDFISSLHKTKTLSPNNSNMESPEIQEMINTYTNAPSKKLKINPELSDMKSRKSLSHPPSFENIEKTHLSINLVSPYNLNFKSGERNIPFWEEDDGKFMVTPLLKISKVVDNTPKYSKVPSKNASFNTFMLKSNENLETFKFDDWKRNSILFQEVKKKEGLIDEEKINQNRQEEPVLSLKKIKKKKNDSEEKNPYAYLKENNEKILKPVVFSPRKLKSPEKFQDTQIFDKMNAKDFIDCQIKRAENSSIQELKQEIEKDVQLLMSPEYLEDTKYEIFLYNKHKNQIFQNKKEEESGLYEKNQDSMTCVQQLAEIWTERSKIFSEYDKFSKMRLCNEVLILKEEKEKMMKQLYKNDYSLLSKEEKTELFQYFAQLSIIDKNDQVRKKKFLIEFTVLKLIKNFLNRQRSIVKQMSLKNNFEDSSHVTENTNKEIMSFNKKESLIEKTQDTRRLECLKSEKDEGYKKYTKKLKDLKSDSPSSFENLYAKFKKTKEKYERNLHNIN